MWGKNFTSDAHREVPDLLGNALSEEYKQMLNESLFIISKL